MRMCDMLNSTKDRQPPFAVPSKKRLNQIKLGVSCFIGLYLFWCATTEEPFFVAVLVGVLSTITFYFCSYFLFKKYVRITSEDQTQQPH